MEHELVKAEKGYLKEMQQAGLDSNCCSRMASDREAAINDQHRTVKEQSDFDENLVDLAGHYRVSGLWVVAESVWHM